MSTIRLNTNGLDKLIRALKKTYAVQVGVLGDKTSRLAQIHGESIPQGKHLNNAEIGAIYEYGSTTHPVRSFLRVPLRDQLQKEMEATGAISNDAFSEVLRTGEPLAWYRKLAVLAESIVNGAFMSNGYGKWKPWKGSYQSATGMILQDTTQLRQSITSRVVEK